MNSNLLLGRLLRGIAFNLMCLCGAAVVTFPLWLSSLQQHWGFPPAFLWIGVVVWFVALMLTVRACLSYYHVLRQEELAREEAIEHYVTRIEYSDGEVQFCNLDENPEIYLAYRQLEEGSNITAKYSTVPRP